MRKITGVLLSLVLLFALAGCSNTATANGLSFGPSPSATQQEETVAEGQSNSASVDAESEVPSSTTETNQEETMGNTILGSEAGARQGCLALCFTSAVSLIKSGLSDKKRV